MFFRRNSSSQIQRNSNLNMNMKIVLPHLNNLVSSPSLPAPPIPDAKKMKWGEPIWFFFHTIAEKVKEERFQEIRVELLKNIFAICTVLPCPKCSTHATEYMNKININAIRTKSDLKNMLFQFHNTVNARKGFPIFDRTELDDKYSKANTVAIIKYFFGEFQKTDFNVSMISINMQRGLLIKKLMAWLNANIDNFDM